MITRREFIAFSLLAIGSATIPTKALADEGLNVCAFSDSFGRHIDIASFDPSCGARPLGPFSNTVLYSLSQERKVEGQNLGSPFSSADNGEISINGSIDALAEIEEDANAADENCLYIDIGCQEKSSPESLDAIEEAASSQAFFFDGSFGSLAETYRALGNLFGTRACKQRAAFVESVEQLILSRREELASGTPKRVYVAKGELGTRFEPMKYLERNVFSPLNMECVNNYDCFSSIEAGQATDVEQVISESPDIILFPDLSLFDFQYAEFAKEIWEPARERCGSMLLEVPATEFSWIGAPLVSQCLGIAWLGQKIHPSLFNFDVARYAKEFYKLFVHCDLSDSEIEEITTGKVW